MNQVVPWPVLLFTCPEQEIPSVLVYILLIINTITLLLYAIEISTSAYSCIKNKSFLVPQTWPPEGAFLLSKDGRQSFKTTLKALIEVLLMHLTRKTPIKKIHPPTRGHKGLHMLIARYWPLKDFVDERMVIPDMKFKGAYNFGKNTLFFYYKWTKNYEARHLFLIISFYGVAAVAYLKIIEAHITLTILISITLISTVFIFIAKGARKASKLKWITTWNTRYTHQISNAPLFITIWKCLQGVLVLWTLAGALLLLIAPILGLVWSFW